MKYVVVLGDGMADRPLEELGGRTPLQAACKPNMDNLARRGEVGMVRTVPEGMPPASDVANLSVMGYDPAKYYTGRSPIEAVSMGIELEPTDVAFRCNLVTLSDEPEYADKIMVDYCADEISTEEARELVAEVESRLGGGGIAFHTGISYRHCMIWKGGPLGLGLTPPHDIALRGIRGYLPADERARPILALMRKSHAFLKDHPVNKARQARGLKAANSIWLWGEGTKPAIPSFRGKYGLDGSVISAVDLIKGLGICAGMKSIDVEGATGNIHTNFRGKAMQALRELEAGRDFVYLHVEAPDECGHRHEIENKVRAIELIDGEVLGPLLTGLEAMGEYGLLIMPDHATPLSLRTHSREPVPYIIYRSGETRSSGIDGYDEASAPRTGIRIETGHTLMDRFLGTAEFIN
jgi:2,3-bisphosphoglycerate-independent phosphoglycerate mutase